MWFLAIANFALGAACGIRFGVSVLAPLVLVPLAELVFLRDSSGLQTLWHGVILLFAVEVGYVAGTLAMSAREAFGDWQDTVGSKTKPAADAPPEFDLGSRR